MTGPDEVEIAAASIGGVADQPSSEDVMWAVVGGQVVEAGEGGDGANDEVDGNGWEQKPREAADWAQWWRRALRSFGGAA
jgi:hypothetical protein